jgi:primosomal protein N'
MYADVEIISNNTYKNMLFTYRVPPKLASKVVKGSIVSVPFRNREYKAVVLATSSSTNVKKIKDLKKYLNITLTKNHLIYLEQLAISNKLNIGILIHNLFDITNVYRSKNIKKQKD